MVVWGGCGRVVSLGSRKSLCINDDVTRLGSDARMSDRCLDMQRGRKEKDEQCSQQCGSAAAGSDPKKPGVKRQRPAATTSSSSSKRCPFLHPVCDPMCQTGGKREAGLADARGACLPACLLLHWLWLTTRQGGSEEQEVFRDYALSRVQPIEELAQLGKR